MPTPRSKGYSQPTTTEASHQCTDSEVPWSTSQTMCVGEAVGRGVTGGGKGEGGVDSLIPGSTGLPGGRKESSTSQSHSTRAGLPPAGALSGDSPGAGQMRCRSSSTSKQGMQSMAS